MLKQADWILKQLYFKSTSNYLSISRNNLNNRLTHSNLVPNTETAHVTIHSRSKSSWRVLKATVKSAQFFSIFHYKISKLGPSFSFTRAWGGTSPGTTFLSKWIFSDTWPVSVKSLYSLKTLENQIIFQWFQGVKKWNISLEWVKYISTKKTTPETINAYLVTLASTS